VTRSFIAVILAGGQSSRMGQDKAQLQRPDGDSQLEFTAKCALQAGAQQVLISGQSLVGYPALPDLHPSAGPLAGIEAALDWLSRQGSDHPLVVLPCDLPYLTTAPVGELLTADCNSAFKDSYLPCLIKDTGTALTELRLQLNSDEKASMRRFLQRISAQLSENTYPIELKNVNSESEWNDFIHYFSANKNQNPKI